MYDLIFDVITAAPQRINRRQIKRQIATISPQIAQDADDAQAFAMSVQTVTPVGGDGGGLVHVEVETHAQLDGALIVKLPLFWLRQDI